MSILDRQSVCFNKGEIMDVATFTAHRKTLAAPGGEIAYTEFGAGPVALFVHGLGTSGALWRHAIEDLSGTSRCVVVDLPGHGGTAARADASAAAMAGAVAELCDGLGLDRVDLVGNDTGGAIAQIIAARQPGRLRTLTLTNCDTEGNFPPAEVAPLIEAARNGVAAAFLAAIVSDPQQWRTSALAGGYQDPALIPDEVWREYLTPIGGTLDRARYFERILAALDPADLSAVQGALAALTVPTLIVWGTGDAMFPAKWAYQLRDLIPGARDVIEIEGAKVFFPEERPADLIPHLHHFWGR
jgi:pimeloyl-ACP methyl ester carboxylesterase